MKNSETPYIQKSNHGTDKHRQFMLTVAVDGDGTIWDGKYPAYGNLLPGAKEALEEFRACGLRIIIHTARCSEFWGNDITKEAALTAAFLDSQGVPYDEIWTRNGKPCAYWYVDDRGIKYSNNWDCVWDHVMSDLMRMQAKWEAEAIKETEVEMKTA